MSAIPVGCFVFPLVLLLLIHHVVDEPINLIPPFSPLDHQVYEVLRFDVCSNHCLHVVSLSMPMVVSKDGVLRAVVLVTVPASTTWYLAILIPVCCEAPMATQNLDKVVIYLAMFLLSPFLNIFLLV